MVRKFLVTAGGLLALAPLLASGACSATDSATTGGATPSPAATSSPSPSPSATPTPTPTPTRTPTKKPFFPTLAAVGANTHAQITGAPAGSVCSVRAFLKVGGEITGSGLKQRTVKDPATGVSWDSNNGDQLIKPGTASGQKAYWQFTCTNTAYDPTRRMKNFDFDTP